MNLARLSSLIQQPDVHRHVLGSYCGAYSLGVTLDPDHANEAAIRLRIEGDDAAGISRSIILEGQIVPVLVSTQFEAPRPLASR